MLLLVGRNAALLEGLAQGLARTGQRVAVAGTLSDADDLRDGERPVLLVVEHTLLSGAPASPSPGNLLGAGCPLVSYHESGNTDRPTLPVALARQVLADLELPLERNRLIALAEHAVMRARTVGRGGSLTGPEHPAS